MYRLILKILSLSFLKKLSM